MAEALADRETLLELRDVALSRGYMPLISGLNLTLFGGDVLWIEGANGCGKTTLLRAIAGLSQSYDGDMLWRGITVSGQRLAR